MHMDAVTPRADGLDAVVAFAEIELGSFQRLAQLGQTVKQGGAVRNDQAGDAAQHVGLARRQMELAHSDIDPHVASARVEKGIARETEAGDVILRRQALVADAEIDVPEIDDIAEILLRPVVLFFWHGAFPSLCAIVSPSGLTSQRPQQYPEQSPPQLPSEHERA